ncbi:CRISPR-associated endonuclease Cas2 [Arcicella sp. DC2W]|uniref:CRISPR-associated endoribonuclease Cas2 n=1 Tax=Arcicella gelida TaxID=2984195 RepID=A0ABU5S2X4_9BACT|nr:CRISPR-associated endonuclease Cas2 [Arcicella sp. DC2W]MEA5402801.1 CRISPR-associated endonuclease Cas2 [Arcicella sp. DC2W]
MIAWVLYDIKNDKARIKVAKICKQSGLYRVQFSVFLGTIDRNMKDSLQLQIEDLIDEKTDSVYIFPMSKNELQETVLLGQAFDKKLVSDEVMALFL